jgi:hypothetical protein
MILFDNGKVTIVENKKPISSHCPTCGRRVDLVTDQAGAVRYARHRIGRRQGCSGSNRVFKPEGGQP